MLKSLFPMPAYTRAITCAMLTSLSFYHKQFFKNNEINCMLFQENNLGLFMLPELFWCCLLHLVGFRWWIHSIHFYFKNTYFFRGRDENISFCYGILFLNNPANRNISDGLVIYRIVVYMASLSGLLHKLPLYYIPFYFRLNLQIN